MHKPKGLERPAAACISGDFATLCTPAHSECAPQGSSSARAWQRICLNKDVALCATGNVAPLPLRRPFFREYLALRPVPRAYRRPSGCARSSTGSMQWRPCWAPSLVCKADDFPTNYARIHCPLPITPCRNPTESRHIDK